MTAPRGDNATAGPCHRVRSRALRSPSTARPLPLPSRTGWLPPRWTPAALLRAPVLPANLWPGAPGAAGGRRGAGTAPGCCGPSCATGRERGRSSPPAHGPRSLLRTRSLTSGTAARGTGSRPGSCPAAGRQRFPAGRARLPHGAPRPEPPPVPVPAGRLQRRGRGWPRGARPASLLALGLPQRPLRPSPGAAGAHRQTDRQSLPRGGGPGRARPGVTAGSAPSPGLPNGRGATARPRRRRPGSLPAGAAPAVKPPAPAGPARPRPRPRRRPRALTAQACPLPSRRRPGPSSRRRRVTPRGARSARPGAGPGPGRGGGAAGGAACLRRAAVSAAPPRPAPTDRPAPHGPARLGPARHGAARPPLRRAPPDAVTAARPARAPPPPPPRRRRAIRTPPQRARPRHGSPPPPPHAGPGSPGQLPLPRDTGRTGATPPRSGPERPTLRGHQARPGAQRSLSPVPAWGCPCLTGTARTHRGLPVPTRN